MFLTETIQNQWSAHHMFSQNLFHKKNIHIGPKGSVLRDWKNQNKYYETFVEKVGENMWW